SPEPLWLIMLPIMMLVGFTIHLPIIMSNLSLLPAWESVNKDLALLLVWSTLFGCSLGVVVYVGNWGKSLRNVWKPLQDLLAYDFYTAKTYKFTVVFAVDLVSKIISWFDNYLVDGFVNVVGFATMFSGQSLKYNVSGQSQSYLFTILVGVVLFLGLLTLGFLPK
ncbi:MAG TPA: NAD(P)H-quinone oxidoreductase subunit F, partial [Allocoleopsis sp.]